MALKDQNPASLPLGLKVDWSIAWIYILKGQVWGLLTNTSSTAVSSVFGRTGAVIAVDGDYDAFYVNLNEKGATNGVATLDAGGLVPLSQLPFSSPLVYQGNWNATTNTPTLSAGTGVQGNMYICSVAGTQDIGEGSYAYEVGDVIVADENGDWILVGSVGGAHINGNGFVIASGTTLSYLTGTSSQFVKANGTLDSNTYLTSASLLSSGNTWTGPQRGAFTTLSYSATTTIDLSTGNNFRIQLTGNVTFNFSNIVAGQSGVINVWQDSTGSRTAAWQWMCVFANGTAPTLSTGKFQLDQLTYMVNRYQTDSVSFTNATPTVCTWTNHGLISGQEVQFTGGSLPTGVSANTSYWINVTDTNTFNIAASFANLQAGTYVATSSTGSGTGIASSITITLANPALL